MISPKVLYPVLAQIVASIVLALVFHDSTFLLGFLVAAAQGGLGFKAPPAPHVTQREIEAMSEARDNGLDV